MYKVLIIEDEDIIRNGLKYSFDWLSLDLIVVGDCRNGEEGLKGIAELHPDIVLLDINMPIKNGIDVLRESEGKYVFSTIIISGYNEFVYAQQAVKYGVTEYLLKPVDKEQLKKALEKAKEQVELRKKFEMIKRNIKNPENLNLIKKEIITDYGQTSKYVSSAIQYIKENYHKKISMNDLVEPLGMSITFLNKKFREETGYTFNEFLNRYRIQKSIEMMKEGKMKITAIAMSIGFSDYRYFNKVFKKYTAMLPSEFHEYFQKKNEIGNG